MGGQICIGPSHYKSQLYPFPQSISYIAQFHSNKMGFSQPESKFLVRVASRWLKINSLLLYFHGPVKLRLCILASLYNGCAGCPMVASNLCCATSHQPLPPAQWTQGKNSKPTLLIEVPHYLHYVYPAYFKFLFGLFSLKKNNCFR